MRSNFEDPFSAVVMLSASMSRVVGSIPTQGEYLYELPIIVTDLYISPREIDFGKTPVYHKILLYLKIEVMCFTYLKNFVLVVTCFFHGYND